MPFSGKVGVKHALLPKLYNHYDLSLCFACAIPRELQGVRRCAAVGRAGVWQLRTKSWLNLEETPYSGRLFKMSVSFEHSAASVVRLLQQLQSCSGVACPIVDGARVC